MTKREKIIICTMVGAVLYGAYSFLFVDSPVKKSLSSQPGPVPINEFVTDLIKRIQAADKTAAAKLIIEKAAAKWQKDPFRDLQGEDTAPDIETELQTTVTRGDSAGAFNYSGYMEMGSRRLAIINGLEYQAGDNLSNEGVTLQKISPKEVFIYNAKTQEVIVVPIQDDATK